MKGLVFDCSINGAIPAGPMYNDSNYRACFLPGSSPGSPYVSGDIYLHTAYAIETNEVWINALAPLLFWFVYIIINVIGRQFVDPSSGGFVRKVFKGGNAPKALTQEEEANRNKLVREAQANIASVMTLVRNSS